KTRRYSTGRFRATHFPPKLLVLTDWLVFWLSVILSRPSQSRDQWHFRVCQHYSSGGCEGFSPSSQAQMCHTCQRML
ncbi:hypothetical protein AUE96_004921, partial [Escherichia coli]|nr:hypothetical protein [Escherichia coli]